MAHAYHWLMVHRSECSRSKSSANCKTYATNCAKKNTMPNSPNFVPPFPPHITIKKTYQFRIDQDSTRIDNKKSKRNCDTKQQTEALSQPLSSLSKNMVVKTVCVIKNETQTTKKMIWKKLSCECDCVMMKLACVPAPHSDYNIIAQRVVDAVCKTKENISARLSLRVSRPCVAHRVTCQRNCAPRILALSNIQPPQKNNK